MEQPLKQTGGAGHSRWLSVAKRKFGHAQIVPGWTQCPPRGQRRALSAALTPN